MARARASMTNRHDHPCGPGAGGDLARTPLAAPAGTPGAAHDEAPVAAKRPTTSRYTPLGSARASDPRRTLRAVRRPILTVNGGGNMYRRGGAKMYHGLGGSLSA